MIYFIQAQQTGLIKIGRTRSFLDRLRDLQAFSPDKLICLTTIEHENNDTMYHIRFASSWSHGEWFHPTDEVLSFVRSVGESEYTGHSQNASNPRLAIREKRIAQSIGASA